MPPAQDHTCSFYSHFRSRDESVRALVDYWDGVFTRLAIEPSLSSSLDFVQTQLTGNTLKIPANTPEGHATELR